MAIPKVGGFGYFALFLGAIGEDSSGKVSVESTYLPDFYYPELTNDMRYPTCTLGNIQGGFGPRSTMADFAFLAGVAYKRNEVVQSELNKWFMNTTQAIHDVETVLDFREKIGEADSSVHFKFVKFPQYKLNMILIRGTQTKWDMLADSQLWTAASLMQWLRALLPFGGMWTPILDRTYSHRNMHCSFARVGSRLFSLPVPFLVVIRIQNLC
jgi:hypothetical protein